MVVKGDRQVNASDGERWIYGIHPVQQRLRKDPGSMRQILLAAAPSQRRNEIMALAARAGVPVARVGEVELRRRVASDAHQGVAARLAPYRYADLDMVLQGASPLLLVDQMHDPNNLGALIRTAAAAGLAGVILPQRGAVGVTAAVEKAAAGAVNDIPVCRVVNLTRTLQVISKHGYWSVALVPRDAPSIFAVALPEKVVLVLGGEQGLRPLIERTCDLRASIPLLGPIESLNASVAGAVAMYELVRRRAQPPPW